MFPTKRAVLTALLLATSAGLTAACADDAPDAAKGQATASSAASTTAQPPRQEAEIVALIKKFQGAVDKGDGKRACALLTSELQGVYAQDPGAGSCAAAIKNLHDSLNGRKLSATKILPDDVDITKKDKEAVVSHELIAKRNGTNPDETESINLEKRQGKWLISYIG